MNWVVGPFSNAPVGLNTLAFLGDPQARFSSIDTSGGIALSHSSMTVPAFVHVSAKNILATGQVLNVDGSVNSVATLRPYERLEFRWDFGDLGGTEVFTDPRVRANGALVNANTDQVGPEAVYCYRTNGPKTITLKIRGLSVSGGILTAQVQVPFQANVFTGTDYYYDNRSPGGGSGTQGSPYNAFGQGPIAANGSVSGNNIRLNFAYGSVFSQANGLQNVHQCVGLRVQPWLNSAFPSAVKPVIESTTSGICLAASNTAAYSDHVYSSIVFRQAASVQALNGIVSFAAPKGNRTSATLNGKITSGSPNDTIAPNHIYGNSNAAVVGDTIFSASGSVAPGTTMVDNFITSAAKISSSGQSVAADDMFVIPVSSCAAFTGSISGDVLTISPPPGYSNFTGCGTVQVGQVLIAVVGSVSNTGLPRTVGSNIDATHWNVSHGPDVLTPQLMICGPGGQPVTDLYLDNCDAITLSVQANGVAVTGVADNGAGFIRVTVASTSIFVVNNAYLFAGVNITGGTVQINGEQSIKAIGAGFVDLNKSSTGLGTYAGGGVAYAGCPGGVNWDIGGNGIFDPKAYAQRICQWGGSVQVVTGNCSAGISFGASIWSSYVGTSVQFLGGGTNTVHQINPEKQCNHVCGRWLHTSSGPGNNSQGNFAFQPRCFAGYTGNIVGDPVGDTVYVGYNFFSYTQNGIGGGVQNNTKPSFGIGWYTGTVIEQNDIGWITNSAIILTGTKAVTVRDNNVWQVGSLFYTGGVGTPTIDGLGADLLSAIYRNNAYRPSAANQGLYGTGSGNSTGIIDLHDGTVYTTLQQFGQNVVWDDRIAANVQVVNLSFSDLAGDSCIIDLNNYWVPSTTAYMKDTPAAGSGTLKTLAQWRAVVASPLSFDANATQNNPNWPNAPQGVFK